MRSDYLFTSESVSEGHPDKVSDQISDAIVDLFLSKDPEARVACETMTTTQRVILSGEIRCKGVFENGDWAEGAEEEIENVVRQTPGFTGEFRMIITRERIMDELLVEAEYQKDTTTGSPNSLTDLKAQLAQQLQATLGIRAEVQLKEPGQLERTQFKARRVIDDRDVFREMMQRMEQP